MFPHALSSSLPSAMLDMTTDFTPLFVGMVLLMSFCVLTFAFTIGVHDSRDTLRQTEHEVTRPGTFPKAA